MNESTQASVPASGHTRRRFPFGMIGLVSALVLIIIFWVGVAGPFGCLLIPVWFGTITFCLIGLADRPRWPALVGAALSLGLTAFVVAEAIRRDRGHLRASDYPDVLAAKGTRLDYFPRAIPDDATGVRLIAYGVFSLFPAPDDYIELRFIVPPAKARELQSAAEAMAKQIDREAEDADSLRTIDDGIDATPVPAGYITYELQPPGTAPIRRVTINPQTGEVVYLLLEI